MSYRQKFFTIPDTELGRSFRAVINHPTLIQNRSALLATIKNTAKQWFTDRNILNNPYVLPTSKVRYVEEMRLRPWGFKGPERLWVEGITIPLRASPTSLYRDYELCIAAANSNMYSATPQVGLRGRFRHCPTWTSITWFTSANDLLTIMHRHTVGDFGHREIMGIHNWPTVLSEPGMGSFSKNRASGPDGSQFSYDPAHGVPLGELYSERVDDPNATVLNLNLGRSPIDFTKLQLGMAVEFKETSPLEITANIAALGISTLCSRCIARYGSDNDPNRVNFLTAELANAESPWLPGKNKTDSYLWIADYILRTVGECGHPPFAKQISDALGETGLNELYQAVELHPTEQRTNLITNLRKA